MHFYLNIIIIPLKIYPSIILKSSLKYLINILIVILTIIFS